MAEPKPVLVAQWGQLGEKELDVAELFSKLFGSSAVQSSIGPQMEAVKEDDRDPKKFAATLGDAMHRNKSGLQIVYIAAHGGYQGIAAEPESEQLSYSALGKVFNATWNEFETGGVALILGTCNSLSGQSDLLNALPPSVEAVIGFASTTAQRPAVNLAAKTVKSALQALRENPNRSLAEYLVEHLEATGAGAVEATVHQRYNMVGPWSQLYPDQAPV